MILGRRTLTVHGKLLEGGPSLLRRGRCRKKKGREEEEGGREQEVEMSK
jgi:hypothetical protein